MELFRFINMVFNSFSTGAVEKSWWKAFYAGRTQYDL
jgi:hypothetical protein